MSKDIKQIRKKIKEVISEFEEFSGHTVGNYSDKEELLQRIKSIGYTMACEAESTASNTCQDLEELFSRLK